MTGLRSFLSAKSFGRIHDNDRAEYDHNISVSNNSVTQDEGNKRKESTHLLAGFQKVFDSHRRSDSVAPKPVLISSAMLSTPATSAPTPKRLYCFQSPRQRKVSTFDESK
jgi:hypothetical protein